MGLAPKGLLRNFRAKRRLKISVIYKDRNGWLCTFSKYQLVYRSLDYYHIQFTGNLNEPDSNSVVFGNCLDDIIEIEGKDLFVISLYDHIHHWFSYFHLSLSVIKSVFLNTLEHSTY